MDWDDLRVFLAVARAGRLAAAARKLGVEHSTVGRRIAALESQIGAPLFHRTSRGYLLTPVGQNIVASAEAMERAAITVGARARETTGRVAGRVRLALVPEFASHWVAPNLPAFRDEYPDIELHVVVGTRELDLSRGEAEIAVRTPHPRQPGLVAVRLAYTTAGLYIAKRLLGRRRLRVVDLASAGGYPLLVYTAPFHALQSAPWFQPVLRAAPIALETNSTHALLAAARAGLGIAVLPRFVARHHDDLVSVSDHVAERDVWLITHPEFRRDPKVRATADFLKRIALGLLGEA